VAALVHLCATLFHKTGNLNAIAARYLVFETKLVLYNIGLRLKVEQELRQDALQVLQLDSCASLSLRDLNRPADGLWE